MTRLYRHYLPLFIGFTAGHLIMSLFGMGDNGLLVGLCLGALCAIATTSPGKGSKP